MVSAQHSLPPFLATGGIGGVIGQTDWSVSPLGAPEKWPGVLVHTMNWVLRAEAQIVLFWGPEYVALYNDAYAPSIGAKHPAALGRPAREFWAELWDDLEPLLRGVRETGKTYVAKDRPFYIERHGYGEQVYFDISYSAIPESETGIAGILCIVSETTERVEAQRKLATDRERLSQMFDQAPSFMALLTGPEHIFEFANASYKSLIGDREIVGKPVRAALPEIETQGLGELLDRVFQTGEPYVGNEVPVMLHGGAGSEPRERILNFVYQPIKRTDGTTSGIFVEGVDVTERVVATRARETLIRDLQAAETNLKELNDTLESRIASAIAEREQAEEALRQAQKMETVGQLTGGIAHDFNNLLQIITGNLETLARNLPQDASRLRRAAENAMTGAKRATTLTQRLLAFSRRQPLAPKSVEPNKLISEMSELLHRTLGETVEIETVLSPRLWQIEVDPNQLEIAMINLAVNARDAMPDGGKLTIETSNVHLDRDYAAANAEVIPGQYTSICVSDTGCGMNADTLTRVFEPFFTTKEVGKGTGLGLSMVYGFIKQSGGHVKIYSEPNSGTTVRLYLPRQIGSASTEEVERKEIVPEGSKEETILVCEDDDDVRTYSVETLRELGYRVLEAHDARAALSLLERQTGEVHLLFTDVVLPGGMTGATLAKKAQALRPNMKVLFTTGYARNAIVHHGRLDPGVELITKPFTYSDLAARVRDVLDLG
ncbi:blue-light-activated protein [Variibacter gotjawalensis]|uniref:histidine kinase n=2 Tax=Variibacter gotjawalensis TaxID=1333996 RepID=A0A0S3PQK2_9BRAD|nr:PAS domain-containing protein [Variibacter gotjawalensis]BAT58186.1 blue-light-activated protein [Variibacter gotjawalensis]